MDKEYFAKSTLHYGVTAPNSLGPRRTIVIPGQQFFDPIALGLSELDISDMLGRGQLLTREQWESEEARLREARVLVDRSNVVVRDFPNRPTRIVAEATDAQLDRMLSK